MVAQNVFYSIARQTHIFPSPGALIISVLVHYVTKWCVDLGHYARRTLSAVPADLQIYDIMHAGRYAVPADFFTGKLPRIYYSFKR